MPALRQPQVQSSDAVGRLIWLDAHLSPALAAWLREEMGQPAAALRDLGLRHAKDPEIFLAARASDVVLMTKDADFADRLERLGPPPSIIWLTCGNTSNAALRELLRITLPRALTLIAAGEPLVEITEQGRSPALAPEGNSTGSA
jgi:predicted nuclease of predicted toxin-antitoxin system